MKLHSHHVLGVKLSHYFLLTNCKTNPGFQWSHIRLTSHVRIHLRDTMQFITIPSAYAYLSEDPLGDILVIIIPGH